MNGVAPTASLYPPVPCRRIRVADRHCRFGFAPCAECFDELQFGLTIGMPPTGSTKPYRIPCFPRAAAVEGKPGIDDVGIARDHQEPQAGDLGR
jgi:hypothetical protein